MAVPTYRTFVDELLEAAAGVAKMAGDRPIVPMLHVVRMSGGHEIVAIEPDFFDKRPEREQNVHWLVHEYAVPLVQARPCAMAAWIFSASGPLGDATYVLVMDREVVEVWRHDEYGWMKYPANSQLGILLDPIQEAMR